MKEHIAINALGLIASGTVDIKPPFRAAPREVLMEYAAKILKECGVKGAEDLSPNKPVDAGTFYCERCSSVSNEHLPDCPLG